MQKASTGEDSARGGKEESGNAWGSALPEAEPGNSGEGKESQGAGTQQEKKVRKRKVRKSMEGRGCLLDAIGKIFGFYCE